MPIGGLARARLSLFGGLHDLGLTRRFHAPTLRFEVARADAARDLVRAHGMDPARADQVWDVAVLHATGGIADCKSPGTAVVADAIGTDVTGLGLDRFDPAGLARIMATGRALPAPSSTPWSPICGTSRRSPPPPGWQPSPPTHPGFGQARVGQLALAHSFETVKSQAQAPRGWKRPGLASIQTASIEAGWHRPSSG